MKKSFFKSILLQYRPSWYFDTLFFWSIFICGTVFVIWLFNNTTKSQIRGSMESRIFSTTRSTAELLDYRENVLGEQAKDYKSASYLSKAADSINAIQGQNPDVENIYLMEWKQGKLSYYSREYREWKKVAENSEIFRVFARPVEASSRSRSVYASAWKFLNNKIFFFFTPPGSSMEFVVIPMKGWNRINPEYNPMVVVVFDAESMRNELAAVDANSSQVIALATILATIVSIVTRRRSIQREEALDQKFAVMALLRQRDRILGAAVAMADQCIVEQNVAGPLGELLREVKAVLNLTGVFLKTLSGKKYQVLGLSKENILGVRDERYEHFDPENLQNPEWARWRKELESGHIIAGTFESFPPEEGKLLLSTGVQSVAVVPVLVDRRLVAVLVIEHHTENVVWEPGLLDTLNLAARLLGSAIMRYENEAHLRHASKMEALGRMGSGVAHEFNNLLHIVSGNLALLSSKLSDHPHLVHIVDGMLVATQRGSKIINQLLRATRQSEVDLHPASINEVVERTVALAQPTLPKGIYLKSELQDHLPQAMMDDGLIQQVVLNLILNARDAIGAEGEIHVQTGLTMHPYLWDGKKYVFCRVMDSGPGIPEKIIESIFDPFFTTKPQGQGTGLGLSTSRGILELHRGHIEASNYAKGATFTFYIPVCESAPQDNREQSRQRSPESPLQKGKVLVGDDEPMCLDLVGDILEESAFEPILACGGEELLEKAMAHGNEIKWVITDWSMPGLSEEKLVKKIRTTLPHARIIVTSGFLLHEKLPPECDGFIQKPFQGEDLIAVMKKISSS